MIGIKLDKGFTLIEVLIAMMILVVGVLGLLKLQGTNATGNLRSHIISVSKFLADAEIENIINNSYENCVDYNATYSIDNRVYNLYCSVNENSTKVYKNVEVSVRYEGENTCVFDYIKIGNYE